MARPEKQRLDYFPLDVDFFLDEKIAAITGEFGLKGESIFIHLLCAIYRNSYFIEWTEMLQLKLVRELPGVTVELLDKVVGRLVKWGVFDESLFSSTRVLSSTAIQKRYFSVARRRANIDTTYLLLDGVGVSADKNIVFDNNNSVSADKNGERKEKKSKENKIISSCAREAPFEEEEKKVFYSILFWRNVIAPAQEVDRFVAYNQKFNWGKLKTKQIRADAAMSWKPQQEGNRCNAEFLNRWQKLYWRMKKEKSDLADAMLQEGTCCRVMNGCVVIYTAWSVAQYFKRLDSLPVELQGWTQSPISFSSI